MTEWNRQHIGVVLSLVLQLLVSACETRHVLLISKVDTMDTIPADSVSDTGADTCTGEACLTPDTDTDTAQTCVFGADNIRITDIDVGQTVIANEEEAELKLIAISPIPGGGSRLAWMGDDNAVHITTLNAADEITKSSLSIAANDFQDLFATLDGGVLLLTREARGGGDLNCGDENNLCNIPTPPIPCFDMYMVRFDDTKEVWATELTGSSATLPPYSTAPNGPQVTMIWWYAHHGRIASSGSSFAAYFGSAISVSTGTCINIHQGDRMQIVDEAGNLIEGGFGWGCSPSGYEQIVWNSAAHAYVSVCKSETAASGVAAFAPDKTVIWNVDPWYANFGELVLADDGGYWLTLSDRKEGQPERTNGLAEVNLLQFTSGDVNTEESVSLEDNANVRAPHLARFGDEALLLLYESSMTPGELALVDDRTAYAELRSTKDGSKISDTVPISGFKGHRYQALRAFGDGSAAMAVKGDSPTTIKVLRISPCIAK